MSLAHARLEEASVEERAVEAPRAEHRRRRKVDPAVVISLFAVLVLAASLLHVGQRARVAELTYELHQARLRLEQLKRIETQLRVDIERARSLNRVEMEARLRLGMVRPTSERLVVVRSAAREEGLARAPEGEGAPASWFSAFSAWYDRVSEGVRAALAAPRWTENGR